MRHLFLGQRIPRQEDDNAERRYYFYQQYCDAVPLVWYCAVLYRYGITVRISYRYEVSARTPKYSTCCTGTVPALYRYTYHQVDYRYVCPGTWYLYRMQRRPTTTTPRTCTSTQPVPVEPFLCSFPRRTRRNLIYRYDAERVT